MELDELKKVWAQYDEKLSKHLDVNIEIIKSINFEKCNNALRQPVNLELLNIIMQAIAVGFATAFSIRLSNEFPYFLMGLTGVLACIISLIFSIVKTIQFKNLLYSHVSIANYQKKLVGLRIFIMRIRKIEYVIAAILGITLFPLFLKAHSDIDIFGNLTLFVPAMILSLGLGFSIGICLNVFFYDKGLKDACKFLDIIDKFEKEE